MTYQTGEVRTGPDVTARVLCVSASGLDASLMTDAQRQYRDDVLRRIDSSWEGERWKGKLHLALALSQAAGAALGKARSDPGTLVTDADLLASALRFQGVPAIEALPGTRVVRTSSFREGLMNLQPPPEEVTTPFYGRRGWWVLDFSASFPSQVERLLRRDRP